MKFSRFCTQAAVPFSLISLALTAPTKSSPHAPGIVRAILSKRKDPNTAGDLVEPQVSIIEQGFKDVIELAGYVITTPATTVDPIFQKYFNKGDEDTVVKVFNQIMGNPSDPEKPDPTGNDLLGNIFVQKKDTESQCGGRTLAYMGDHNTDDPFIVVCDILFKHKGLFDTKCEDLGDNVSYKMLTIAGTLLHEYTHWNKLAQDIVGGEVIDQPNGYGPVNTRTLDKSLALKNADNYAYFASEVFWSVICEKSYADPRAGIDDDDPACDGICQS
ncbi:MAG: hypothetical protein M1830_001981 [Pleopsidium flavum]|nr:MAG: hypothetical protein M1830_001981 [Pleopsidium flavum]